MIEQLQYITQDHPTKSHVDLCREACLAGIKWVQLRMKNVSEKVYLMNAQMCREITHEYGAKLIINDNLDVALKVSADGVHLGQTDLNTAEARSQTPSDFIIGGTANTLVQIIDHHKNGVDYVGVGPFRFTSSKDNLSPILGLEGYAEINRSLNEKSIEIPVIAIGGIQPEDVASIKTTGVHGVAVASVITDASDKTTITNEFKKALSYARS